MLTRYRLPPREVQPVTWLSRSFPELSLGDTSVAFPSANRNRCPASVPIHSAPPELAMQEGTSSFGKFMGFVSLYVKWNRTSVFPSLPTLVSVLAPESATNRPLLIA